MRKCPMCRGNGKTKRGHVCIACEGKAKVSETEYKEIIAYIANTNKVHQNSWALV